MDADRTLPRFFVDSLPAPAAGADRPAQARLPAAEAHHALHVLRLGAGAAVALFDGRGGTAVGRIAKAGRGEVLVAIDCALPLAPRPGPRIHLGFAVPKGGRLDWLLEKATELGAASLVPVIFARSVAGTERLSPAKRERWRARTVSAAKQCGLDYLPEIADPLALEAFLARGPDCLRLLGDLSDDAVPLARGLARRAAGQELVLLVGPEGGLTAGEGAAARLAGFIPVRLGATALRIETAAVALLAAAVALCDAALGDKQHA